jgi:hypothetical protein
MFPEGEVGMAGGGMVSFAGGGGIDFDRFRNAIIQQESGGDYGVVNRESGAMGAYQFMPATAQAIARRLGLPYRPELMQGEGGRSEEGRAYQEALGREQLNDAIQFSGGDIGRAGIYHFAGPNTEGWGPQTRRYEQDILRRYGGNAEDGEARAPAASSSFPLSMEDFMALTEAPEVDYEGNIANMRGLLKGVLPDTSTIDELMTSLRERNAPEEVKEQREQDLWGALADFGFRWASSGNLAESAGETFSGLRETIEGRREQEFEDLTRMVQLEGMNIDRAMVPVTMGIEAAQKQAALESAQKQQAATFASNMSTGAQSGQQNMAEIEREAQLNPPDAADPITPSDLNPHLTQVESDFAALATNIGEGTTNIPQRIRELYAAAAAGQMDQAAARAAGARYYYNAMIAAAGAGGTGAGAGAGVVSVPWVASQGVGSGNPGMRALIGQ